MHIAPDVALVDPPVRLWRPTRQTLPLVLASPHSGSIYPPAFQAASRLSQSALRRSEDCFVHEIFQASARLGAPLLSARFPRAYCDVNREPHELDPSMFDGDLPSYANTSSLRVAGGLGTIARVVSGGEDIYAGRLPVAEAERRIRQYYRPYHAALARLVEETRNRFGFCILLDCHSMPSSVALSGGGHLPFARRRAPLRPDIVLGDRFGTSCLRALTDRADESLTASGYQVARNAPYAGGFTTSHYGRPEISLHALQIEINRGLYMDEDRYVRTAGMTEIAGHMTRMVRRMMMAFGIAEFSSVPAAAE